MDERKLKGQLIRITAITIVSSILLSAIGIGILTYVLKAAHDAEHIQMKAEAEEYKVRILKQMDANIQILTTLAKEYEVCNTISDRTLLEKSLEMTNTANDFTSVAYISKDGTGVMNAPELGIKENVTFADCHPYAAEAMEKALQGENTVSRMFDSEIYDGKLFVYAVPVYYEGAIIGTLAASDTMEIFTDISNGDTVMGGKGYVHLINTKGEFLVRSENTLVKEQINSIFDGPYLSDDEKQSTKDALENQQNMFGEFTYKGEKCHFYIASLDMNGWYLFCANSIWDSLWFVEDVLIVAGGIMLLLVAIVNILLYSGYNVFRKNTKSLLHIAYWDAVTQAENVIRFDQNYCQTVRRKKDFSTVVLNVHNFKAINDLFGKKRGDIVLCYLKKIIEENMNDGEFFCRDTADFFYLFILDTTEEDITRRLRKIIDSISEASLAYGEYRYDLSLYAGVAIRGDREKALLALQSIQHSHHVDIAFYNQDMHDEVRKKNRIESHMYPALQNKEFKLFLQPKVELKTGRLIGAEALVRWQNPDGTYIFPGEFIPLFEANGFCLKLDMYMIERVCEQIREWVDAGIQPIPISVNQSKLLFSDLNYPANLSHILERYDIPASLFTLEILEGVATDNLFHLNHQIEALHAKGFRISMDDFGSGYSSLNMLYQLKIDELKLDRGFLRKTSEEGRERSQIILRQIVEFSKKLGIVTVAEGIETQEDRDTVLSVSCDYGQGYFYGKPVDKEEFSKRYMKNR